MDNKDYTHLFTKVEDKEPEKGEWVYCFDNYKVEQGFMILPETKFAYYNITHWLDLSQLTTKKRALELAEEAFIRGNEIGYTKSLTVAKDFINENKSLL